MLVATQQDAGNVNEKCEEKSLFNTLFSKRVCVRKNMKNRVSITLLNANNQVKIWPLVFYFIFCFGKIWH